MANAIYAPQNDDKLVKAFNEEMAKVYASGFSAQEVADAKTGWLQQRQVSRSNDRDLAQTLAGMAEVGRTLVSWTAPFEKRVASLTVDEVNAAVHRRFDPSKISIVRAGDFAKAKNAAPTGAAAPVPPPAPISSPAPTSSPAAPGGMEKK
jgi:zinc protease